MRRWPVPLAACALLLAADVARAAPIELWSQTAWFARPADGYAPIAGSGGWTGGMLTDAWTANRDGTAIFATTDLEVSDVAPALQAWGSGGPTDDYLIHTGVVIQGGVAAVVGNHDNDALGLVLGFDVGRYFLAVHSCDSRPPPLTDGSPCRLALLRVDGSLATQLGAVGSVGLGTNGVEMRLERNDDHLTVFIGGRQRIDVAIDRLTPGGRAGVWAYDNGVDHPGAPTEVGNPGFFEEVRAYAFDDDADGFADDTDVCPKHADPGQEDRDHDGIGDVCDPYPDDGDDDTALDSGFDSGDSGATPEPSNARPLPPKRSAEVLLVGCGCGTDARGSWTAAIAALALLARRRRS